MKSHLSILLSLVFVAHASADVGLYVVTKKNIAKLKEFRLQTGHSKNGAIEFKITIPFDSRIKKVKVEHKIWSADMNKILDQRPANIVQRASNGPWVATVTVHAGKLQNSTIDVFCERNLPAETAYRIPLGTYATNNPK